MSSKLKLILLVTASTVIRLILGANLQLGNDEVYYWTYALFPDWSHFDHPPMVGFFQQIFSLNLLFDTEIALRLGFIISGSLSTLLFYFIGKEIKDERTGLVAAILYNTSIYGFILSGLFIMPDGPLVVFWMASLLGFIKFIKAGEKKKINFYLSLSLLSLALAIYSKYQAVYLLFGYALYLLVYRREQLRNPVLYLNLVFSGLVVFIIFYWNYLNSFTGMSYHSDRVTLFSLDFNIDSFFTELVGQLIYNNPYNYILILIALLSFKRLRFMEKKHFYLFLFLSLPLILTTLFFSLYRDTLPHWSGVAFLSLVPVAAAYLSGRPKLPALGIILLLVFGLSLTGLGVVNKGWVIDKNRSNKDDTRLGRNDPTLDMYGWDQFKLALESIESDQPVLGSLPIVANKWYPGSHLYYYVAKPMQKELYVLGDMKDMHKYYWINQTKPALVSGQDGIYFTLSRNFKDPEKHMSGYFNEMVLLKEFPVKRSDKTVEYGYLYLLKGYKMSNLEGIQKE
jgi:4-amino-4-deoxy-L-arabinose transferase-like glycosyltransferase